MKNNLCLILLFFTCVQGTWSQDPLLVFSEGPGRVVVHSHTPGRVFSQDTFLGSVGPEEPLLVHGLPEGRVELTFISDQGGRETKILELGKNGIPTIRFETKVTPVQGNERARAVSLAQGSEFSVPLPVADPQFLTTRDSRVLLASFQFHAPEYRGLNAAAFFSKGWFYFHPRYSFQWSGVTFGHYNIHQLEAAGGVTAFSMGSLDLYTGISLSAGWVDGEKLKYWSYSIEKENGIYLTAYGLEYGANYYLENLPCSLGLRLFTGYSRGMEWLYGNSGLTISGELTIGWRLDS